MRDMEEKYGPVNIFYYDDRVFDIVQELAEVNCQFRYTNKTWNNVTHVVSYDSVVDTCNPHVLRAIVNGIPAVTVDCKCFLLIFIVNCKQNIIINKVLQNCSIPILYLDKYNFQ